MRVRTGHVLKYKFCYKELKQALSGKTLTKVENTKMPYHLHMLQQ